jgi:hypothetical protein
MERTMHNEQGLEWGVLLAGERSWARVPPSDE